MPTAAQAVGGLNGTNRPSPKPLLLAGLVKRQPEVLFDYFSPPKAAIGLRGRTSQHDTVH